MTIALSALTAVLLGTLAIASVERSVSSVCPGLQSLCHWVMIATMAAGMVLGGLSGMVGAFGALNAANALALACAVALLTQIGGWVIFLRWFLRGMPMRLTLKGVVLVQG